VWKTTYSTGGDCRSSARLPALQGLDDRSANKHTIGPGATPGSCAKEHIANAQTEDEAIQIAQSN
jgi:hypothetical protein